MFYIDSFSTFAVQFLGTHELCDIFTAEATSGLLVYYFYVTTYAIIPTFIGFLGLLKAEFQYPWHGQTS